MLFVQRNLRENRSDQKALRLVDEHGLGEYILRVLGLGPVHEHVRSVAVYQRQFAYELLLVPRLAIKVYHGTETGVQNVATRIQGGLRVNSQYKHLRMEDGN